jgi:hypothetical protein
MCNRFLKGAIPRSGYFEGGGRKAEGGRSRFIAIPFTLYTLFTYLPHLLIYLFTSSTHLLIYLFTYLLIYLSTYLLLYLFTSSTSLLSHFHPPTSHFHPPTFHFPLPPASSFNQLVPHATDVNNLESGVGLEVAA